MNAPRQPLAVVGASYVGLVTAAGFAEQGHDVWCADVKRSTIEALNEGRVPISEPRLEPLVQRMLAERRLHFVHSVTEALAQSRAEILFVAVGTPPGKDGADLSQVQSVIDELPDERHITVVMKSTVPPGTGRAITKQAALEGKRFTYVSCPEFLQEGEALKGVRNPVRVVVGGDNSAAVDLIAALHDAPPKRVRKVSVTSAEGIKLVSNVMLAMRISAANEIANYCEEIGADAREVLGGVGLDPRIGPHFLEPGPGFGGSCLGKDVSAYCASARDAGLEPLLGDALLEVNRRQARRVVEKLRVRLDGLDGRRIALLGLAFKPETGDLRNGSAFTLAHLLRERGASVRAYDPDERACFAALENSARAGEDPASETDWITPEELADDEYHVFDGADACVLVTPWDRFLRLDWDRVHTRMSGNLVLDSRNKLNQAAVEQADLVYEGTGRCSAGLGEPPGDDGPF